MVTRIYANAVAKYNEGKLLDREKLYRLADAEYSDAVKMLCDYGYGGGTSDEKNFDADAFISRETASLIDYVFSSAPDEHIAKVLTCGFLYTNAKAYYKEKAGGKISPSAVYSMDDGEVKDAIQKGDYAALSEPMASALTRLDALFAERVPDPKTIDIELTRARYADALSEAKEARNKSLVAFVRGEIDVNNILSALRAARLSLSESALESLFIEGGKLDIDDIFAIFKADDKLAAVRATDYDFMTEGLEEIDLPVMESRKDAYLAEIWERDAENMQSLAPFVSYFLAQLSEYKTVGMILTCLRGGAREEISRRLVKGDA